MNALKRTITALIITASIAATAKASTHKIEFEADPIAYGLGGASGHIAYTWKNERIQLGFAMLELPEALQENEAVGEKFKAISLKWDYFFGRPDPSKGFFVGPVLDYLFLDYRDNRGDEANRQRVNLGLRAGYKLDLFPKSSFFKGLYITPWVSTSYIFDNKSVELSGNKYALKSIKIFPTVHIGWSF